MSNPFRSQIKERYLELLNSDENNSFPADETIRVDMHCHDYNSTIPDELWGRILALPETWLKTEELIKVQQEHGAELPCVTNHNNARSSWNLLEKGVDVLVASEFTCHFPEMPCSVHVLAYGFTPEQEIRLNRYRHNIYRFLKYTTEKDIPLVLPHPLYYYLSEGQMPVEFFEKLILLFERFEVFNGQRDIWQNLLTWEWLNQADEDYIRELGRKHEIDPHKYCSRHPFKKIVTGGSDDHFGIFSGQVGTKLHIPNLKEMRREYSLSHLALEAIKEGRMAPYGVLGEEEKLNTAFIDYVCQVAMNMKDPGLIRLLLHKGTMTDKVSCLALGNAMMELKRHKHTMRFFSAFHDALHGKKPRKILRWMVHKDYKSILNQMVELAEVRTKTPEKLPEFLHEMIPAIFKELNLIIAGRLKNQLKPSLLSMAQTPTSFEALIQGLEIPLHLREMNLSSHDKHHSMTGVNLSKFMDELSFPTLASLALGATAFGSSRVLYQDRDFLNRFSNKIQKWEHPQRILWLTDTLMDKNGVSSVLQQMLKHVQEHNLPIDILVCSNEIEPQDHLRVVESLGEFKLPGFESQEFRVPDLLEIQKNFKENGYDRIICSTEFSMGGVALYLKEAFQVPTYFLMHTDWVDFAKRSTNLNRHEVDRVRRLIRAMYDNFDGIFALNEEHKHWLSSRGMDIDPDKIHLTAHWADERYYPREIDQEKLFPGSKGRQVFLFAGRMSKEKGVMDLQDVLNKVQEIHPDVYFAFAGTGPAEEELKEKMPEAHYLGWVQKDMMPEYYSAADMLLLPSSFDTFGCVVLEAMACGTPVSAYAIKGPKDIIEDGLSGLLSKNREEMAEKIIDYLNHPERRISMSKASIARAKTYSAEQITHQLMFDMGMVDYAGKLAHTPEVKITKSIPA